MNLTFLKGIPVLIIVLLAWGFAASGQTSPESFYRFITAGKDTTLSQVKEFYRLTNFQASWLQQGEHLSTFSEALKNAAQRGLRRQDYSFEFIDSLNKKLLLLKNSADSAEAEIRITKEALHFYTDLAHGNAKPVLGYNGLNYSPNCNNIPLLLSVSVKNNLLSMLPEQFSTALPEIKILENRIRWYATAMADSNFKEITISSAKVSCANTPLVTKLYQLGITDSLNPNIADSLLKQKVKEAQRQFGLQADGTLRKTFLDELNIPLSSRLAQLNLSINYYRWLTCLVQQQLPVIVVNIPAAYLKVYRHNSVILEMRMIVGARSTPTPTLASSISQVILYPYWRVPFSIATKELLPAIKKNPGYIDAGNYQVLNRSGKIVDPYSVNWHALNSKNFPYIIRQSTGCDNALGLIKLDFYNPFSVYLHDTPTKSLFMLNKRYFSHGCMRMEKPMELGHLVLKNNSIAIDTLEEKGCLRNQAPVIVPADAPLPVIVWYNPAGVDSTGRIVFYEDVYKKFTWSVKK